MQVIILLVRCLCIRMYVCIQTHTHKQTQTLSLTHTHTHALHGRLPSLNSPPLTQDLSLKHTRTRTAPGTSHPSALASSAARAGFLWKRFLFTWKQAFSANISTHAHIQAPARPHFPRARFQPPPLPPAFPLPHELSRSSSREFVECMRENRGRCERRTAKAGQVR